nr:hypothetical protein [Tanacetum cinerariifolium]
LEKKRRSRTYGLKRLYKVGLSARVESSAKEQSLGEKDAFKQGRNIADIDADAEITLVDEIVDGKKVIIFEATIRRDLKFEDKGEVDCLSNEVIFKQLTLIGLEKKRMSRTYGLKRLYKVGLSARVESSAKEQIRDHKDPSESTTIPTSIVDSTRPKANGIVMEEPSEVTTTIPIPSKVQDKCKGIMVEEPLKMKKKDKISFDEQEARKLQAELDQEQRLEQRLAEEEAQKALEANIDRNEEKRNRPPTKAQQRSIMSTYLNNMDGWKPRALKNKYFAEIKELFDKEMTWINNFVDFRTKLVKESSKKVEEISSIRTGDELEQESAKKQKVDHDQEAAELKRCLKIVSDDEDDVTIDATPLSSKSPTIIDYKIHKEGRKGYF